MVYSSIAKEAHYRLLARQREIEEGTFLAVEPNSKIDIFQNPKLNSKKGMTEEERLEKFNAAHKKRLARQREMIPKVEIPILEKQQKSDPVKLPALSRNLHNGQNVNIDDIKIYCWRFSIDRSANSVISE